jgi:hypothetical protein
MVGFLGLVPPTSGRACEPGDRGQSPRAAGTKWRSWRSQLDGPRPSPGYAQEADASPLLPPVPPMVARFRPGLRTRGVCRDLDLSLAGPAIWRRDVLVEADWVVARVGIAAGFALEATVVSVCHGQLLY